MQLRRKARLARSAWLGGTAAAAALAALALGLAPSWALGPRPPSPTSVTALPPSSPSSSGPGATIPAAGGARPGTATPPAPAGTGSGTLGDPFTPPPPPVLSADKQRGVALGMFAEDVSFSYAPLLAEIVALGATHVALVVPVYQTDGASHDLDFDTRLSPTLGLLAETVRAARRYGLEVTVFPIVRLRAPRAGEWRGTLAPADPDAWFRRWAEVLGDLGAVAASTGASRLVVGSELSSLDGDLDRWRPVIERVRAVFTGKLIYSANWDHYRDARLFDLVDEEGVTGYFELRDAKAALDDATLEASWRRLRRELEAWRATRPSSAPFLFTELGYRSRAGASAAPWNEEPGGRPDLDEQRRAFAAFRRAWSNAPSLSGVYIWNWYGHGGPGTSGYTPRGKPAEVEARGVLRDL